MSAATWFLIGFGACALALVLVLAALAFVRRSDLQDLQNSDTVILQSRNPRGRS